MIGGVAGDGDVGVVVEGSLVMDGGVTVDLGVVLSS